ncbi:MULTISPECIES: glycerophosphodiester phosphodiesterase [unclassified Microbulbifer]|uniref:glycerophosphodiester phosphodiesterase n=1 Tax=unclassified Microbulbifer TaxID=2619833 RepID=UPI0027E56C86|nr:MULTISPECIES: glycerophosphodiester phosphodiesterase [unclassified Microbulbifer]
MIHRTLPLCLSLVLILAAGSAHATLVIAHRGASGYLPEHTLEAKALAYAMRPDYIEQDLVLSKDNRLIVMHDIYLDDITDVAQVFPGRVRKDGRYYTIDFTLTELKRLRVTEAFRNKDGNIAAKYPRRFPLWQSSFQLSTLEEEIELIQGLNKTLGYDIGIYPEIKNPAFHRREGRDIAVLTLVKLKQYGYTNRNKKIYLQCFDAEELQRIKRELMPQLEMDLPLVQLIAKTGWSEKQVEVQGKLENYDYDWMLQPGGLEKIATYADAIGPWLMMMIASLDDNQVVTTDLVQRAHRNNLVVHPYTFRADSQKIPQQIGSFERLLELFIDQLNVDGLFTDHPDKAVEFISRGSR